MNKKEKRNYGWGRQAGYAGAMLVSQFFAKRHGTRRAYKARWQVFANYLKNVNIRDVRYVSEETLIEYADHLQKMVFADEISISYAVNLLSTVNVIMMLFRGDRIVRISPKLHLGTRVRVRVDPPAGFDKSVVRQAAASIMEIDPKAAICILLAREAGLRKREA